MADRSGEANALRGKAIWRSVRQSTISKLLVGVSENRGPYLVKAER